MMDSTTAAIIAVPKPLITKEEPISPWVNIKVIALMTNKNNPKETTVIGSVKIIKIGFTITFKIDKIILANSAVPKPSM